MNHFLSGELSGAGYDGRSGARQGGLCQTALGERGQHPSLPHYSQTRRVIQHGRTDTQQQMRAIPNPSKYISDQYIKRVDTHY